MEPPVSITRMDTNAYVSLAIEGKIASKVRNTIFLSYKFSCMICFVSSCFFVCLFNRPHGDRHHTHAVPCWGENLSYIFPDVNECLTRPCLNGGTCQNLPGSYKCKCKPGFLGRRCETGNLKGYFFLNHLPFEYYLLWLNVSATSDLPNSGYLNILC